MTVRGIRGAITVKSDQADNILEATKELLKTMVKENPDLQIEDIASTLFSTTADLVSTHPAAAARELGWDQVPMMCCREIPVPESLPLCIRVLVHWNTDHKQNEIHHVYLRDATSLRPDLVNS
jgi:chorismate mutase